MLKYGVLTTKGNTKNASDEKTCPRCGNITAKHGNVVKCETHGTEPFEETYEDIDTKKGSG